MLKMQMPTFRCGISNLLNQTGVGNLVTLKVESYIPHRVTTLRDQLAVITRILFGT